MVYRFPPSFKPTIVSHGNLKDKRPYYPTWPSTRELIKTHCKTYGPKATIEHVSQKVGGIMEAKGPGQLPRNERQITNIRKKERLKEYHQSDCAGSTSADDLVVVIKKAHTEDPSTQFIRAIRAAPDPAIVLANDYQIHDMVTFSTSSSEFCVLTIDLTFSLGEFHAQAVTPITYHHLLLETKRTGTNPVFLGPTLIHYRKTFAVYYIYFLHQP